MERTMSVEDKIRRAEEIYQRRQEGNVRPTATVNVSDKKDVKLLKKMILQIIACLCIYLIISTLQNNNYIFSEDFLNKIREVLSYDTNFVQIYNDIKQTVMSFTGNSQEQNTNDENIGGAEENQNEENVESENEKNQEDNADEIQEQNTTQEIPNAENQTSVEDNTNLTQEEQDVLTAKNTTNFIKPIEGEISSKYGLRNPTTQTVPKNHTGVDIKANQGTVIRSATEGEVTLSSSEGDYGNHLKIQIGEVSIIYAHCLKLYVKQGDKVIQGQEIAEVGSTGNSTGPHLHFEVRVQERCVDPEKILQL